MDTTSPLLTPGMASGVESIPGVWVTLSSGTRVDISELDTRSLEQLQWREERAFADLLRKSAPGSAERGRLFGQAYDTVTTILHRIVAPQGGQLEMGYDRRYARLVADLCAERTRRTGRPARFFEIGFGCGALLEAVQRANVEVGGIEVSAAMRQQALQRLPESAHQRLLLGNFLELAPPSDAGYDVIFWNDVLEHLVPDESLDFLRHARACLAPGGSLVTITPNWHMRPSDVSGDFLPPRSVAEGLHLKEYTLREVATLLRQAGFQRVSTPLFVTRRRMHLAGTGLAGGKSRVEPALEWLPFRLAKLFCRGFGLSCTIAQKSE